MKERLENWRLLPIALTVVGCGSVPTATPQRIEASQVPAPMRPMLDAHNSVRSGLGLPPLGWSDGLATYAQQWADHLAATGCRMAHRSHRGAAVLKVGENLYWASPRRWSDGRIEVQPVAAAGPAWAWASERADYDERSHTCTPGKVCGHYTQMVWHTTRLVGCAYTVCPDLGQIWACNYDPPGNWVGQRPY